MKKIQVSAINYTNTKPFLYGLQNTSIKSKIEISLDFPAQIAYKVIHKQSEIGIIPLIEYLKNKHSLFQINNFGIACNGEVDSVALLSHLPLEKINCIILDYQSNTSVALCKILAEKYWEIKPKYIQAEANYEMSTENNTAVLIIGDRVFDFEKKYAYKYDLGLEWKKFTNLPFVFAVWVSNTEFDKTFLDEFNQALLFGIQHIDDSIMGNADFMRMKTYLKKNIQFELTPEHIEAIKTFENNYHALNELILTE